MTQPRNAILFDLGNVLVKWDLYAILGRFFPSPEAMHTFLAEVSFHEWNAHQDRGRPFADGIAILCDQHPQHAHIFRHFHEHWEDSIQERIEENVALAARLKREGYPIFILSNFSAETYPLTLARHPFLSMFDDAIVSGQIGLIKPEPAIFQYTLNRIGRAAGECLFIDDSLPNIETAQRLGLIAIHFRSPAQLQRDLQNLNILQ